MSRLIDLARSPVQILNWTATAAEALQSLYARKVSGAPVCDESMRPLGVLTLSSINAGVALRKLCSQRPVHEFMTPLVFGLPGPTPIRGALESMVENRIHRVFAVSQEERVEGVLSAMDALFAILASASPGASALDGLGYEWRGVCSDVLDRPVGEVMQSGLYCVSVDQKVASFIQLCEDRRIAGTPVLSGQGQAIGVLSQTDVARYLLHHSSLDERLTVGDVMTPFSFTLNPADDLHHAVEIMIRQHIHRILVTNSKGFPLGVVSSLDVIACLIHRSG